MTERIKVTLLAGGFGGARMAQGFAQAGDEARLTVIGNTGDDLELHGLYISPDLDTVMYTLAGLSNNETGWGVRDESWSAAQMLERYGEPTWFKLGDRDLATHVARTARLRKGDSLTTVTREPASALGVQATLLPMSDDVVRTKVRTADGWLEFQDYFVRRGHRDDVEEVRFDGMDLAKPTPDVLNAVKSADLVVIAPSNPFVSVAPYPRPAGHRRCADRNRCPGCGDQPDRRWRGITRTGCADDAIARRLSERDGRGRPLRGSLPRPR